MAKDNDKLVKARYTGPETNGLQIASTVLEPGQVYRLPESTVDRYPSMFKVVPNFTKAIEIHQGVRWADPRQRAKLVTPVKE